MSGRLALLFLAGVLFSCGVLLLTRLRACGARSLGATDFRDCFLGGLIWPLLLVAFLGALLSMWVRRLLPPRPKSFFGRLPDGRLADALSIEDIAATTSPEEKASPLMIVVGGVGRIRIAAKAGLSPATYRIDGASFPVREMTYIGEVADRYETVL